MATSGTTDFNLSIDDAIEEAYERCGLQTRTGYDLTSSRRVLNIMFAEWANRGLNLWTIELKTQTLTASTASYSLGTDIVDIVSAVVFEASDTTIDYEVERISRAEYLNIPKKSTEARPSQYYLERTITPTLYLYPTPDAADTFKYYALTRINDAGAYTNNAEIPFRFIPCMVAGLAYYISMKKSPERIPITKAVYDEEWARAAAEDTVRTSVKLVPSTGVL